MIVQGTIYCTGNLESYLVSYFSCETALAADLIPVFYIASAFFAPIGSWLAQKNYPRTQAIIFNAVGFGSLYTCSLLN